MHRIDKYRAILVLVVGMTVLTATGCKKSPTPYIPQLQLGLDIWLYNQVQETNPNENVTIAGILRNERSVVQRGVRVNFVVTPDSIGQITAFSDTNPDSATGFEMRVTFIGRKPGVALITGTVYESQEIVSRDTVRVRVRDPING